MTITNRLLFATLLIISFTSCEHSHDYGPNGLDGRAFFGVDYNHAIPYSYWDDNPRVPSNPYFGEFYRTEPGWYEFEYFVNPTEYWYGSYQMDIEPGGPGLPHGEVGEDGADTYLTLFLDPEGWTEDRFLNKSIKSSRDNQNLLTLTLEGEQGSIKVKMSRTTTAERPSMRMPKFIRQTSK